MTKYYIPVKIYWGQNSLSNIDKYMEEVLEPGNKVLLITGANFLRKSGYEAKVVASLATYEVIVNNQVKPNPDLHNLLEIKEVTDQNDYSAILAIGGGSVIDVAKMILALKGQAVSSADELRKIVEDKSYQKAIPKDLPLIAVPTTSGTGSEVTSWATLWDEEKKTKYSMEDNLLFPKIAIIDPELTQGLPLKITAATGLDAMSHALEAYWSKNSNEIVRLYALKSIEKLTRNLEELLGDLSNLELREEIAMASLYAGMAFSNTKTTACHSISYPLSVIHDIDHGVAVALTLGKVLELNKEAIIGYKELLLALNIKEAKELGPWIDKILSQAGISYILRDYGLSQEDLEEIADKSYTPGRMDNNPVDINRDTILEILKEIY